MSKRKQTRRTRANKRHTRYTRNGMGTGLMLGGLAAVGIIGFLVYKGMKKGVEKVAAAAQQLPGSAPPMMMGDQQPNDAPEGVPAVSTQPTYTPMLAIKAAALPPPPPPRISVVGRPPAGVPVLSTQPVYRAISIQPPAPVAVVSTQPSYTPINMSLAYMPKIATAPSTYVAPAIRGFGRTPAWYGRRSHV